MGPHKSMLQINTISYQEHKKGFSLNTHHIYKFRMQWKFSIKGTMSTAS